MEFNLIKGLLSINKPTSKDSVTERGPYYNCYSYMLFTYGSIFNKNMAGPIRKVADRPLLFPESLRLFIELPHTIFPIALIDILISMVTTPGKWVQ